MAKASDDSNQNQPGVRGPYFCEECKRNHTKGKIYKEHLSFAKFESVDDELIHQSSFQYLSQQVRYHPHQQADGSFCC